MSITKKAKKIQSVLDKYYPEVSPPLEFSDHYTLLIAVLLSAQCTDERVNQVTRKLFSLANNPQSMLQLGQEQVLEIIRPCGLAPTKSKNIIALSEILLSQYNGFVPSTLTQLEALPGVGHKTASVVLVQGFDTPAFPVDTHIIRSANRWGLSAGKNADQVERDLKLLYPAKDWAKLHLQIILFSRKYCKARPHDAEKCPMCSKFSSK